MYQRSVSDRPNQVMVHRLSRHLPLMAEQTAKSQIEDASGNKTSLPEVFG